MSWREWMGNPPANSSSFNGWVDPRNVMEYLRYAGMSSCPPEFKPMPHAKQTFGGKFLHHDMLSHFKPPDPIKCFLNLSFSCNCVRKAGVLSLSLSINDGRERKLWMEALLAARDPVNLLSGDISASRRCESSFSSTRNPQVSPWPRNHHKTKCMRKKMTDGLWWMSFVKKSKQLRFKPKWVKFSKSFRKKSTKNHLLYHSHGWFHPRVWLRSNSWHLPPTSSKLLASVAEPRTLICGGCKGELTMDPYECPANAVTPWSCKQCWQSMGNKS